MAGWKLRKDKASADTPDPEAPEAAFEAPPANGASAPAQESQSMPQETEAGAAPTVPDFDSDHHFTDLDFDDDKPAALSYGAAEPLEDDEPLKLVDYTEPSAAPADLSADSWFLGASAQQAADTPAHGAAVYDMSPMSSPADLDFSQPVTSEFDPIIPVVAPFVLDTPAAAPPPAAPPQLVVHFGRLSASFALVKEVTTIGRPDSTLHYYPDVEIEMDDAVSRRHAEVVKRPDGYFLVDTGSTNGTQLNGERLPAHEERLLMHGDRIKVGDRTEITFE